MSAGDLPPSGPAARVDARPAAELRAPPPAPRPRDLVPLFVIGIVALGVGGSITAFNAGSDALDNFTSTIDSATNGTSATPTTSTPSEGTSLIGSKALKAALAKLPAGDIELLRLAPDR